MLSLLVVFLFAGLCNGQGSYFDCATGDDIVNDCATEHLAYIAESPAYTMMKRLDSISQPDNVLPILDTICTEKTQLMEYFHCTFSNMTTCLKEANSSQIMGLPDSTNIGNGFMELCDSKDDLNRTCIMDAIESEVQGCFVDYISGERKGPCDLFEGLVSCAEGPMAKCGGDEVLDFVVSARPHSCPYTGSGAVHLASVLLMMMGALLAHYI